MEASLWPQDLYQASGVSGRGHLRGSESQGTHGWGSHSSSYVWLVTPVALHQNFLWSESSDRIPTLWGLFLRWRGRSQAWLQSLKTQEETTATNDIWIWWHFSIGHTWWCSVRHLPLPCSLPPKAQHWAHGTPGIPQQAYDHVISVALLLIITSQSSLAPLVLPSQLPESLPCPWPVASCPVRVSHGRPSPPSPHRPPQASITSLRSRLPSLYFWTGIFSSSFKLVFRNLSLLAFFAVPPRRALCLSPLRQIFFPFTVQIWLVTTSCLPSRRFLEAPFSPHSLPLP